jgi:hypothetical protein
VTFSILEYTEKVLEYTEKGPQLKVLEKSFDLLVESEFTFTKGMDTLDFFSFEFVFQIFLDSVLS